MSREGVIIMANEAQAQPAPNDATDGLFEQESDAGDRAESEQTSAAGQGDTATDDVAEKAFREAYQGDAEEPSVPGTESAPNADRMEAPEDVAPRTAKELQEEVEKLRQDIAYIRDKSAGSVGGLARELREMRESFGKVQSTKLNGDDFPGMRKDMPEVWESMFGMSASTGEPFNEPDRTGTTKTTAAPLDQEQIAADARQKAADAFTRKQEQDGVNMMEAMVPNWQALVGATGTNTPYRVWLSRQPLAYQEQYGMSDNPILFKRTIDDFHKHVAAQKVSSIDPRLAAAVQPSTTAPPPGLRRPTETVDEAFRRGYEGP